MATVQNVKFVPPGGHRACANCSISKARCITPEGATKCERCQRLKKDCYPKAKSQRRRRQAGDSSQGASGVASASGSGTGGVQASPSPSSTALPAVTSVPSAGTANIGLTSSSTEVSPVSSHQQLGAAALPLQPASPAAALAFTEAVKAGFEADYLLADFREHKEWHSLCTRLPPDATAASLREQSPLIFLSVIMAANYYDHENQQRLVNRLLAFFTEQIMQQGMRSRELLDGIVFFEEWMHVNRYSNPQIIGLIHMSTALGSDLGLERPLSARSSSVGSAGSYGAASVDQSSPTLDSCRALAASYYFSNLFFTCMGVGASVHWSLHWSPQLTEAIAELERHGPSTSDGRLATLTKMQQIICRSIEVRMDPATGTPLPIELEGPEKQLEDLLNTMPRELREDTFVMIQYYTAQVLLYKHSIPDETQPSAPALVSRTLSQAELQYRCLSAVRRAIRRYYSIHASTLIHLPARFWGLMHCVNATLGRICILAAAQQGGRGGWPPNFVRSEEENDQLWDFEGHMENMARRLEEGQAALMATGRVRNNDMFERWAAIARTVPAQIGSQGARPDLGLEQEQQRQQERQGQQQQQQQQSVYQHHQQLGGATGLQLLQTGLAGQGQVQGQVQGMLPSAPDAWGSTLHDWTWEDAAMSPYAILGQQENVNAQYGGDGSSHQPGWYPPPAG